LKNKAILFGMGGYLFKKFVVTFAHGSAKIRLLAFLSNFE
jgi:hypothetical protein